MTLTNGRAEGLRRLLAPRHLAFMGGARAEAALNVALEGGYKGKLWPVSAKRREIAGIPCYPSLADLPEAPDATFVGIPAAATVGAVAALADMGGGGAICYASGFSEAGADGAALQAQLVARSGDLAIVGPNCFGIINYVNHGSLWPTPYPPAEVERGVAILAQSGNLAINLSLSQRAVPFAYNISIGNQAVLGIEDYVEVLSGDPHVAAIGLYIEGLRDIAAFSRAARLSLERGVPIVAMKLGTSEIGAQLTVSHTSSVAGADDLYQALFDRLGVIRVGTVPALLETLKALVHWQGRPARRLAVFSCSGGDSGMSADFADKVRLALLQPSDAQTEAYRKILPEFASVSNPLDYSNALWGQEEPLRDVFTTGLSEGCDAGLLVIDHPPAETGQVSEAVLATVRALGVASRVMGVPAAVASVLPEAMPATARRSVLDAGLLPLQGLADAMAAVAAVAAYAERRGERLPDPVAAPTSLGAGEPRLLEEGEGKNLLAQYGVRVPHGRTGSIDEIPAIVEAIGGRAAVKAASAALPHKSEAGAVVLGVEGAAAAVRAAEMIRASVAARHPGLAVDRFLVEEMVAGPTVELLVGIKRDPQFGLVAVVGGGGIMVELMHDAVPILLPAARRDIEAALRRCAVAKLLDGFRGRPPADWSAALDAIEAVLRFAEAHRDRLLELDVNPLMVLARDHGAVAADALVRMIEDPTDPGA